MEVKIHFLFNNGYIIYNLGMGDNIFLIFGKYILKST